MNIVVYGAGALGLYFAGLLSTQNNVFCISRKNIADVVKQKGVVILKNGEEKRFEIDISSNPEDVDFGVDIVILASKSYDSQKNLQDIKNRWPFCNLITLQNGIYTEDLARKLFKESQIFPMVSNIGSRFVSDNVIEEFLNHGIVLGSLKRGVTFNHIATMFGYVGIDVLVSDNIMRDKWKKFMFYCGGATINALTDVLNLENESSLWITKRVLDEICEVGKKLDLDFDIDLLAKEAFEFMMSFKPKSWKASVGQDLRRGRKTEIDYLNGYLVKLAKDVGVDVPVNETLYRLVKTLETTGLFTKIKD